MVYHSEVEVLNEEQKAVFNTLVYSGIFDYPLKPEEIFLYLINDAPCSQQEIVGALGGLKQAGLIEEREGLFFLKNREAVCDLRKKREVWSQQKLIKVRRWIWLFRLMPWVRLVAVTGAVVANNADQTSDIDLMVIADSKRIWLTRLLTLGLLKILGLRVDLKRGLTANRFCVNLFIADDCLEYPQKNLYTANEIIRVEPIFERDDFYQKFLSANLWTSEFLPNLRRPSTVGWRGEASMKRSFFVNKLFDVLEKKTRNWQIKRIRRNFPQTVNIGDGDLLSFQPNDCSQKILAEYEKRRL